MFLHPGCKWIKTVLYRLILLLLAGCTFKEKRFNQPVSNGSFEALEDAHPKEWKTYIWSGKADMGIADFGHSGEYSVFIASEEGADASWGIIVPVNPFSRYRLSGWIKTENLHATTGRGVLFNLHGMRDRETGPLTGTNDWTQVSIEFDTERNDAVHINCLFGGWGRAAGKAWFDDVRMELLSSEEIHPSVTIHTDRQRAPISQYIYGQFIEHLGRCIYGGLWAEMLEDRKFFYPVMDTYQPWGTKEDPYWKAGVFRHLVGSPWKAIGPPGSVHMETDDPFVGEHTPVVRLPGNGIEAGIGQEGLALMKGKRYVGRVVLAGDEDASPVEIRLILKNGEVLDQTIEHLDSRFKTYPLKFESPVDDENAVLGIISQGKGVFKIGTVSLMPADHVHGWRADVIQLLKELNAPIYRWPGGNFVSGYNWRDGIGDPDLRPPRKNPAWTGVEHNDVGIHEYMELMDIIDAEPFIAVNTGLGTVREVAEEVAYCNSPADTPLGRLRVRNGHPGSFNVEWWAVGNEMYGSWQLGHIPLSKYIKKHNRVAEAMRQVDPSIRLVAVGSVGEWSETMLRECSDHMNLISEHIYCQEMPGLLGHTGQLAEMIRWKAGAHRSYRDSIPGLREKDIRIAMDEWNFWYGDYIYGELGVRYFLKDGLGVAIGLHEFFRNSDLYYMANYAQTVNVIGCIKTTRTEACFAATGVVLKLYRDHFGSIPVDITGTPGVLDVAAAWTEDREQVTLAVVNPTRKHINLPVGWEGILIQGTGTQWIVTGTDPLAFNEPGEEPAVFIHERSLKSIGDKLKIPALSICIYAFPAGRTE